MESVGEIPVRGLFRFNADGSLDATFEPDPTLRRIGGPMLLLRDGNIVVTELVDGSLQGPRRIWRLLGEPTRQSGDSVFEFATDTFSGFEGAAFAEIIVSRNGNPDAATTVDFAATTGTATVGEDFELQSGTLTFAAGEIAKTFRVPLWDDGRIDGEKTVALALSNPGAGAVLGARSKAELRINDDVAAVEFLHPTHSLIESAGPLHVELTRSGRLPEAVEVRVVSRDESTTGNDFDPVSTVISFGPNETRKFIEVRLRDDRAAETDESFSLIVEPERGLVGPSSRRRTTVTILDDERPGRVDISFAPDNRFTSGSFSVLALQPDGKVVVGGGSPLTRFESDGQIDFGFQGRLDPLVIVLAAHVLPDRKMIVLAAELSRATVLRLHSDGSKDNTFGSYTVLGQFISNQPFPLAVQPDGKVLLVQDGEVIRLTSEGRADESFRPYRSPSPPKTLAVQADGRILVGGQANEVFGRGFLVRLRVDGTLDTSFMAPDLDWPVHKIASLADGKIVLSEEHEVHFQLSEIRVRRLLPDGSPDPLFRPFQGINGIRNVVKDLAVQVNGKILGVGQFDPNPILKSQAIFRLNADGSFDGEFDPGGGPNGLVNAVAIQPDGRIIIAGQFSMVSGVARNNLARLNGDFVSGPPPVIISAKGDYAGNEVIVEFDKPLDRNSAQTLTNYRFAPCTEITGVLLAADQRTVTLTFSRELVGPGLNLRVDGVKDLMGNTIAPNSTVTVVVPVFSITDGLVGHYQFDGTARDSSPRANHAMEVGSPAYASGLIGQALSFNGTDQLAQAGDPGLAGNGPKSISVWFKQTARADKGLVSFGNNSAAVALFEVLLQDGVSAGNFGSDALEATQAIPPSAVGEWQHAVITYNGKRVRSYVNGLLANQTELPLNTGAGPLLLGSGNPELSHAYFNGLIDDVGLWNRALESFEVSGIYYAGRFSGQDLTRPSFPAAEPPMVQLLREGNQLVISYSGGVLQAADDVRGPWQDLFDVCSSPTVNDPIRSQEVLPPSPMTSQSLGRFLPLRLRSEVAINFRITKRTVTALRETDARNRDRNKAGQKQRDRSLVRNRIASCSILYLRCFRYAQITLQGAASTSGCLLPLHRRIFIFYVSTRKEQELWRSARKALFLVSSLEYFERMMTLRTLAERRADILRLAQRYRVGDVRVFGSKICGDNTGASDVDLLIKTAPGCSLFDLGRGHLEKLSDARSR